MWLAVAVQVHTVVCSQVSQPNEHFLPADLGSSLVGRPVVMRKSEKTAGLHPKSSSGGKERLSLSRGSLIPDHGQDRNSSRISFHELKRPGAGYRWKSSGPARRQQSWQLSRGETPIMLGGPQNHKLSNQRLVAEPRKLLAVHVDGKVDLIVSGQKKVGDKCFQDKDCETKQCRDWGLFDKRCCPQERGNAWDKCYDLPDGASCKFFSQCKSQHCSFSKCSVSARGAAFASPGPPGPPGAAGPPGPPGATGAQGEKGAKGDKGDQGIAGVNGAKGQKGDQGDKGDTGEVGAEGPQGEQGEDGLPGPKGDTGPAGPPAQSQATIQMVGGAFVVQLLMLALLACSGGGKSTGKAASSKPPALPAHLQPQADENEQEGEDEQYR
eukprot:TRINITY_DN35511_c0_g1_i1.p1 TRINITY_DN35511_c0_g1~~TRINITY_DN35511_c0_g1_i1.p1  ORF type:complete len:398 (-),score=56.67 TRINITY_DN35511_c0_g1_i1:28-1170(-)